MELKDYTIEELKSELSRRNKILKAQKEEERRNALRCRNCKHFTHKEGWPYITMCSIRTWGKTYVRHYAVKACTKACEKFERKEE